MALRKQRISNPPGFPAHTFEKIYRVVDETGEQVGFTWTELFGDRRWRRFAIRTLEPDFRTAYYSDTGYRQRGRWFSSYRAAMIVFGERIPAARQSRATIVEKVAGLMRTWASNNDGTLAPITGRDLYDATVRVARRYGSVTVTSQLTRSNANVRTWGTETRPQLEIKIRAGEPPRHASPQDCDLFWRQKARTMIHELGHAFMLAGDWAGKTRNLMELEAELFAFRVWTLLFGYAEDDPIIQYSLDYMVANWPRRKRRDIDWARFGRQTERVFSEILEELVSAAPSK